MSRERGDYHGDEDEIEFILTKEDIPDEDLINELREIRIKQDRKT